MEKKNTKIFIIYGKARHGKDTVAGIIEEYYKNEKVINLQISLPSIRHLKYHTYCNYRNQY